MKSELRNYVILLSLLGVVLSAGTLWVFPLGSNIAGLWGLAFWILLTNISSTIRVRFPRGTLIGLEFAPLLAATLLGGPTAAIIVGTLGTFDFREIRGSVPWYGVIFNHMTIAISALAAALVFWFFMPAQIGSDVLTVLTALLVFMIGALVYFSLNSVISTILLSLRFDVSFSSIWLHDIRGVSLVNFAAMAPIGWLMAQSFQWDSWLYVFLFFGPLAISRLVFNRYAETQEVFRETVATLANAVDARDTYTLGHSRRVMRIAGAMAREMKISLTDTEHIEWAGLLHDIGKIGIRDNILLKEGPLNDDERLLMSRHPEIAAQMLQEAKILNKEVPLIYAHHEWFNGGGYPHGLRGQDIPLGARILVLADSFEAMTSSRPYRKTPLSIEQAKDEIRKFSGIQFDPELAEILLDLPDEILINDNMLHGAKLELPPSSESTELEL